MGHKKATDPGNTLARIHSILFTAFEDEDVRKQVGWMPSHLKQSELGKARKSDGSLVNQLDLKGNNLADLLAKRAVELHRVDPADVEYWRECKVKAESRARWVEIA